MSGAASSSGGRPGASAPKSSLEDLPIPRCIRENYVLVPRGADQKTIGTTPDVSQGVSDGRESKSSVDPRTPVRNGGLLGSGRAFNILRNVATSAGTKGHRKPILRINLVRGYAPVSSAANTALTAVTTLHPQDCAEWSSFSTIFDEARCTGISVYSTVQAAAGGVPTDLDTGAIAFDPANATAYSRLDEILVAENALGPITLGVLNASGVEAINASIAPMSKTGYLKWGAKVSPGPTLAPGVSGTVVGGAWFDTSDSSEIVGYLKPYLENSSSTGGTATMRNFVVFHMEFRSRS